MATIDPDHKKKNFFVRFFNMNTSGSKGERRKLPLWRQILLQLLCLLIAIEVMFPIMYIITLSFSSKATAHQPWNSSQTKYHWWLTNRCLTDQPPIRSLSYALTEQRFPVHWRWAGCAVDRGYSSLCLFALQIQNAPGADGPGLHPAADACRWSFNPALPADEQFPRQ